MASAPLLAKRDGAASEWCWDPMFFGDVLGAFDSVELGWRADCGRCVISSRDIRKGELIMHVPALACVLHSSSSESAHELGDFGLDAATVKLSLAAIASSKAVVHALASAHTAAAASTVGSRIRRAQQLPPDLANLSDVERAPPTLGSQHRTPSPDGLEITILRECRDGGRPRLAGDRESSESRKVQLAA